MYVEAPTFRWVAGGLGDGIQLLAKGVLDLQAPALLLRGCCQHQGRHQVRGREIRMPKQPRHPLRYTSERRRPALTTCA